jgi:uncharacterized glyoxalase superfamily protein PhnB
MTPTPAGWPRIASHLVYRDPARMIDWLCLAFGFSVQVKVVGEGGRIEHSQLSFGSTPGEGLVMLGHEATGQQRRFDTDLASPLSVGANTQTLLVHVDDIDAHCQRARAAGARIVAEPALHDYGPEYWADRSYGAADPEGHLWWFTQRVRG